MVNKIEISHKTIIFTVIFLFLIWFLYFIREIVFALFVALLIMATLNPTVTRLARYRLPRPLAVLLVYLMFFSVVGIAIATLIPLLVDQTTAFLNNLPTIANTFGSLSGLSELVIKQLLSELGSLPAQVAKITITVFSNILGVISVLILAFYFLLARNRLDEQVGSLFGDKRKDEAKRLIDTLEHKLGGWARGELLLMLSIGVTTYIGLNLIGIPYALPLSILAGILEIVPTIGPTIAAIPPAIVGFGISPFAGFTTIALAFLIQQLENYILVPRVMQASAGVSPIATLLSLAIGFRVGGAIGALIAVPVFITIQVLAKEFVSSK